jgi:hypothetical protein
MRDTAAGGEHMAERPSWDCRACGSPWPCDPAREALTIEMDRVALSIYMWLNLEEAARDIFHEPVPEVFGRFIQWIQ